MHMHTHHSKKSYPFFKHTTPLALIRWLLPLLGIIFFLTASPVAAATCTWNAAADGNWSDSANWRGCGGLVPGAADDVIFNSTSSANATIDVPVTIRSLTVDATYGGQISMGTQSLQTTAGFVINSAPSFNAGTGLTRFAGGQNVNSAAALYDVQINTASGTITLLQNLAVSNDLTITAVAGLGSNGGSWQYQVSGDVTSSDTAFSSTNTSISVVGSSNQRLLGAGILVNLDVAKSGGNVVLESDFILLGGTLTGTGLIQNSGGVLVLGNASGSYTVDFAGSIDDLRINVGNGGSNTVTLNQNLTVNNTLTIQSVNNLVGSGGVRDLLVLGDVIINDISFSQSSAILAMVGGGSQNLTANVATSFSNLTVGVDSLVIETVTADNLTISSVTNNGTIRKIKDLSAFGTAVNVGFGLTQVTLNANSLGTLANVQIDRIDSNYPNATAGIETGRYWSITPTGSGFNLNMTLPHNATADANDKVCRYTGVGVVWDCAANSFVGSTITRNNITELSDWATSNDTGPTAVTLLQQTNSSQANPWLWLVSGLVLLGGTAAILQRRRVA